MLDVRLQARVDGLQNLLPSFAFLNVAVDAVLDEDFFQRSKMPSLLQLCQLNLQLPLQEMSCSVGTDFQDF